MDVNVGDFYSMSAIEDAIKIVGDLIMVMLDTLMTMINNLFFSSGPGLR